MASNREILEAQRFNRSRLTTAFTSGLPGGRELEPRSTLTPLIVGLVITALLIATGLVLHKFSPSLPDGWQDNHVLVIKDTGARYYTIGGVMHPVTNITSAKLLTPAGSFNLAEVAASKVEGIPRGEQLGLPGAPDDVPAPSALLKGAWTACAVSQSATSTWVGAEPAMSAAQMALVDNQDSLFLVADGARHPIGGEPAATLTALGLVDAARHPVRADWLDLATPGTPLAPLVIGGAGLPTLGLSSALAGAVVGSLVDVTHDGATTHYVVVDQAHLVALTDVAYAMYQLGTGAYPEVVGQPITATLADVANFVTPNPGAIPEDWPATIAATVPADTSPCLRRDMADGAIDLMATDQPLADGVNVPGGSAALIQVQSGGTLGAVRLISDNGLAYGISGDITDTLARLGYSPDDVMPVPSNWAALASRSDPAAPVLSPDAVAEAVR